MPKIQLAHGGGGKASRELIGELIIKYFGNATLNELHDASIIEVEGKLAMSTDSFVVSPLFFPGGNIGELAINGTVNDLAMAGAKAKYLSLAFILEEGFELEGFEEILKSIAASAAGANVLIVTGDTKVVEKGKADGIYINTTGVGVVHSKAAIKIDRITSGDAIILSNGIASHGMAIMTQREGLSFQTELKSDTTALVNPVQSILEKHGEKIHFLRDATRGGVSGILNEIVESTDFGFQLDEDKIPVGETEKNACEILGLDPLQVANEGVFIAIVSAEIATDIVTELKEYQSCRQAAIIGSVVNQHPKKLVLHTGFGGRRVLVQPHGEQLPRIC